MEEAYKMIKMRRVELGMTQTELARLAGYENRSSIARIERGDTNLPFDKIVSIAEALKVTPSYLMGWEDKEAATFIARQEKTIGNYFSLTEKNQIIVDSVVETLLNQQKGSVSQRSVEE